MSKFTGNLNTPFGTYRINENIDYFNESAMIVETIMNMGMSLFKQAETSHACHRNGETESSAKKACSIMNMLFAWKEIPSKRPPECATSWLEDAWYTLHNKYEELQENEIL